MDILTYCYKNRILFPAQNYYKIEKSCHSQRCLLDTPEATISVSNILFLLVSCIYDFSETELILYCGQAK